VIEHSHRKPWATRRSLVLTSTAKGATIGGADRCWSQDGAVFAEAMSLPGMKKNCRIALTFELLAKDKMPTNMVTFPIGQCNQPIFLSTHLEKNSPIILGRNIESKLVDELSQYHFDRIFFFTEPHLFDLIASNLYTTLSQHFDCILELIPPGEGSKGFVMLEEICEKLISQGASKRSLLISFGGGVVGNIVGLAAGLVYRGIRYIEIPTTMTAQTDSTLSNKQAVNGRQGKNHFGLYHAPILIWTDTNYLTTEPPVSRRCGIIEAIKNGFIDDASFLDELDRLLRPDVCFDAEELHELVYKIIQSKLRILKTDPSEKHRGIILEYGHTFGHGLEWLLHGSLTHGEAVSFGMKLAAKLSQRLSLIDQDAVDLHWHLIENKLGFVNPFPANISAENLMEAMVTDNKKTGRELRFVLLDGLGSCHNPEGDFLTTVDAAIVVDVIREFITAESQLPRPLAVPTAL
jgi:3-dehydroquinate synthetase